MNPKLFYYLVICLPASFVAGATYMAVMAYKSDVDGVNYREMGQKIVADLRKSRADLAADCAEPFVGTVIGVQMVLLLTVGVIFATFIGHFILMFAAIWVVLMCCWGIEELVLQMQRYIFAAIIWALMPRLPPELAAATTATAATEVVAEATQIAQPVVAAVVARVVTRPDANVTIIQTLPQAEMC